MKLLHRCSAVPITLAICTVILGHPLTVQAIIFHSTSDPTFNTTAPTGELQNSGWQLQGRWGNFLGTPIAPNLFITAKHVGGAVGGSLNFQGVNYSTLESFASPTSDLRIYRICGTFPEFAQLYDKRDEMGKPIVVFGRGTQRGDEVIGNSETGTELKGWKWGATDRVMRWGENTVSTNLSPIPGIGELMGAAFDANGGANEGHLSSGDSGGAIFANDGGTWKLAGINYAVDGPFNTNDTGGGFNAALFDLGGVYEKNEEDEWAMTSDQQIDKPSSLYATRISGNINWIEGIISSHGHSTLPALQSTTDLNRPFTSHPNYTVDESSKTISIDIPTGRLFLRIADCNGTEITGIEILNGKLILTYGNL